METTTDFLVDQNRYGAPKHAGQPMEKADFLRWESDDNYVYEYNDGLLEPTTSMKQEELPLLTNLENYFFKTSAFQHGDRIRAEVDVWLSEKQMRRPDVAYFTREQLQQIAAGENVIPRFVIEFSSEYDDVQKDLKKLHQYFQAGIQVVWWVYPLYQTVYVYTSPKMVVIATDSDVLSTAPVLSDWPLTAEELFRK